MSTLLIISKTSTSPYQVIWHYMTNNILKGPYCKERCFIFHSYIHQVRCLMAPALKTGEHASTLPAAIEYKESKGHFFLFLVLLVLFYD